MQYDTRNNRTRVIYVSSPCVIVVICLLDVSIFNNSCSRLQILFAERLQFVYRMSAPGEWAVPESHGMGAYVSAQYCSFRQILQRPYHNGIRNRNLGSGSIGGQTFGTPRGITWTKGLIFFSETRIWLFEKLFHL